MSKKIVSKIVSLANILDEAGRFNEADVLTNVAASVSGIRTAQTKGWDWADEAPADPSEEVCPECDGDMEWDDVENKWHCPECDHSMEEYDETAEDYYGYDPDQDDDIY
jgi:rubredoxin